VKKQKVVTALKRHVSAKRSAKRSQQRCRYGIHKTSKRCLSKKELMSRMRTADTRVKKQKVVAALKRHVSAKRSRKASAKRSKRAPSAYNLFMKSEIPKVKRKYPELSHTEAFKRAAKNWGFEDKVKLSRTTRSKRTGTTRSKRTGTTRSKRTGTTRKTVGHAAHRFQKALDGLP